MQMPAGARLAGFTTLQAKLTTCSASETVATWMCTLVAFPNIRDRLAGWEVLEHEYLSAAGSAQHVQNMEVMGTRTKRSSEDKARISHEVEAQVKAVSASHMNAEEAWS